MNIRNCHIDAVAALKPELSLIGVVILVDGTPLRECYVFDEAEGWAEAWQTDADGGIRAPLVGVRVRGEIRLTGTPEQRVWYEEHFGVGQ